MPKRGSASAALLLLAGLASASACAKAFRPGSPQTIARAKQATTYSGELRLMLNGPQLRARTGVLVGFRRPESLRIEVPGPGAARLIAVAAGGRFVAVFPVQQAFFDGDATPQVMETLFGIGLGPSDMMDLLVGVGGPTVSDYRADWGASVPERVEATMPDGGKLKLRIVDAELDSSLTDAAFEPPHHEGFRRVTAEEARTLWQ